MQHSTNELYVETDRVSRLEERMKIEGAPHTSNIV